MKRMMKLFRSWLPSHPEKTEEELVKDVVDSSLSNNEGYTNALRALESYHITNKNYSEAGKCVEEIIVKEIAVGNKNKVKELALAAIEYYNKDKMWECGVQVQRLVSDVVKLDEKESPLSESIEKTCDPGVRIFPVYFYVEVTVDGESTESYIVKGRPTDKLVNCKEAVMERWPDCVVKGFGEYCADNAPKGKRFVSIHPCSPSKLEESFANENNLPKGIWVSNVVDGNHSKGDENTNVNVFLYSTPKKDYTDPEKKTSTSTPHNDNICWIAEHYIVPENPFPSISRWEKVSKVVIVMKKPIYSCCDVLKVKINQLKAILLSIKSNSSDKHNKRGLNALQQNLMGVIAAGVNGGPKVYASTFLCESYYRDNTEDSGVLAEMCVLLKELLTVTKEGLDVLEKCDECSKKYCDTIKGIYAEMTNEINTRVQKYEKIHSKGPLLNKLIEFPAQSMALSLRLTTRIKTTPKTEAATAPEAAAAAAATSKTTKLPEASEEKMTEAKEYVNVLEQSVRHTVIRDRPQTTLLVSTRASRRFSFSQIRGLMSAASNTNNSDVNGPEPVLMMKSLIERHPRVVKMDVESLD